MVKAFHLIIIMCFGIRAAIADDGALGSSPFTILFDTQKQYTAPLTPEEFAQAGEWMVVPSDATDHAFQGDAVVANDRLASVMRNGGEGVELYALGPDGPVLRAVLQPVDEDTAASLHSVTVVKNAEDGIVLDATYSPGDACGLRLELALGQVHVKTQALGSTTGVRVVAPCRFAVMPDFFADDIVLDARTIPLDRVEQPSENLFMQMVGEGNGIVMTVWQNRDQDIAVNLAGNGNARELRSTEIAFGPDDAVWVAVLDEPGIWHARDIAEADLGEELPLDWRAPYEAIWRVDWHRTDGLTDSWEMIVETPDGTFTKPDLFEEIPENWEGQDWWSSRSPRSRWNTVLGR